ncbi:DMT family transporter [Nocardioides marmotae]|uniref:EamA family transporter n=1 Tax=Nocardioides marmotae TaxID=2663857 RepID=A0A6I3JC43_9ACTN|nr:DMT family transporter [Nocardioides marmotae]MCR6032054.1 EamA family transporter [Gordonia jinghuaiqii]MBC9732001.1 DMT family transporter [Nocardioides marmotae]MTB83122.1 EamA family transporter [Nocardioides marmotae]MTB95698.1 EamA family transporter [Nocardioides marmotae]QKE01103.1 DMT family transporter [Nocardioides marmotae]
MGALLALGAALAYGVGDFVGGFASQRVSPWAVVLTAQLGGAAAVLGVATVVDGSPTGADLAWAVLGGVGNGLGTACLYRGLSSGRMGVVAPVSGVSATLLPVLVAVASGERPGALVWLGTAAALPAIWLVAREPASASVPPRLGLSPRPRTGALDGLLAGLGFGTLFVALAEIPEEAGLLPLALNQLVAGLAVVAVALVVRAAWVPRQRWAAVGLVSGVLGATATGCFMLATREGYLTVAAVLTSLYPAVTVVLAAVLLREAVHRSQALGLVLCAGAVVLVAAG